MSQAPLGREGFARLIHVSRETLDRLDAYLSLLASWNKRINLVGPSTLDDPWRRHLLDSAQLLPLIPAKPGTLIDLGSGAGLPGLILSMLGIEDVHLVDSDQRKCAFLREAARVTGASVTVHASRIEQVSGLEADLLTARALAPLGDLLTLSTAFRKPSTACYFLKGERAEEEIAAARAAWRFSAAILPSLADPRGRIVRVESIESEP